MESLNFYLSFLALVLLGIYLKAKRPRFSREFANAIRERKTQKVLFLLNTGTNPNAKDSQDGSTPLHLAVSLGNLKISSLLFLRGADVNAKDNSGETPLHVASYLGKQKIASYLVKWEGASTTPTGRA